MARFQNDLMLDAALDWVKDNTTKIFIIASTPNSLSNYASVEALSLASAVVASTIFTKADGDVSGRKLTVAIVSGVSVTTGGTATHIVLANASVINYISPVSSQVLTAGNSLNTTAYDIELEDSAAP